MAHNIDEMQVPKIARRFVGIIKHYPVATIILTLLIVAGLSPGFEKLHPDFTHRAFFWKDDPLLLAFDRFERRFGNDDAAIVAVYSPSGVFDVETANLLVELTEKMWLIPEVIRVDSLSNFNWVHADGDEILVEPFFPDDQPITPEILAERKKIALKHETLPNYLVSKDATTAMVFATVKPGIDEPPNAPEITAAIRKLTAELKAKHGGDHEFYITGGPPVTNGFKEASEKDMKTLLPIVLLMTIGLLWILLRSFLGIVYTLLLIFLSIASAMALSGWFGIEISNVTAILPQILIAVGVADAIHILVNAFRAMEAGMTRKEATEYSLLKNFVPTFLTSLTTAIGFFSFATADLKPIAGLGRLAGCGTMFAWLFTYLFVGGLMFLIPMPKRKLREEAHQRWHDKSERYTTWLFHQRNKVTAGFGAISLVMLVFAAQNTVNSDPFKYFERKFPLRIANEFVEKHVGGARGCEIVIDTGKEEGIKDPEFLRKVDAFEDWITALPGVTRTVSIVDILKQTHRSLNGDKQEFYALADQQEAIAQELFLYTMSLPQGMNITDRVTVKNDALRMTVLWTIATSREVTDTIHTLEAKAKEMGLNANVTGKNRLWQSMNDYVVRAFLVSLTSALVLISLALVIFFRSFKLGVVAMVPNGIPLIIGAGALHLLGETLNIGTVLVMAVCLGIAVDDTIHILANFRRLKHEGKAPREAVVEIFALTSPALVTTTLVLVCSFGTFIFATFTPNMWFGVMVALILTVALLADLIFLPAMLLGKTGARTA